MERPSRIAPVPVAALLALAGACSDQGIIDRSLSPSEPSLAGNAYSPAPASLVVTPNPVLGGDTLTAVVTLSHPAPAGGTSLLLRGTSIGPGFITVPRGVQTITSSFPAPRDVVTRNHNLTASTVADYISVVVAVEPDDDPYLGGISVDPYDIVSGQTTFGVVRISPAAPAGGAEIVLTSLNPTVLSVPASILIAEGGTTGSFPILGLPVADFEEGFVRVSYGGYSRTVEIFVMAP